MDLGERFLSTTFYTKFTTVNASGLPTTLGSTPSLQFYVGAGTTAFTAGLSLDADFNSVTGLNHVTVIATTSATAWATGIDVQVVVATGTVSGVSIKGYKVCEFSLQNRGALRPVTQGRNLVVESDGMAYADAREWLGGTIPAVNTTGVPKVDLILGAGTNIPAGAIPNAVAGAAGGLFIAGSNAATTVNITGNITGNLTGSVGSVTGAVGSVTAGVTVTTNNDKTGYALSATGSAQLTYGIRANGAAGTLPELLYEILLNVTEFSNAGTTRTLNLLDHTAGTTAYTYDSATNPTSITRSA